MKKILVVMIFFLILGSCASSKNSATRNSISKADKVVENALKYKGVKYKFGGTTKRGMDCSGLVYVAFGEENFKLPRVSREMAKRGKKISLRKAKKGDLVFFKTSKSKRKINHLGLITAVKNGQIWFIHSTSSQGVIVSSLSQKYWEKAFVKATSIL
jgi:cell wall-associated NlpC family hydrolase